MLACVMLLLGEESAIFENFIRCFLLHTSCQMKGAWEQGYSRVLRHGSMNMRTTESIWTF